MTIHLPILLLNLLSSSRLEKLPVNHRADTERQSFVLTFTSTANLEPSMHVFGLREEAGELYTTKTHPLIGREPAQNTVSRSESCLCCCEVTGLTIPPPCC